jgi:hypothetical protein
MRTWIAGILATIISGVVVFYVTNRPTPVSVEVAGSVVDASTKTVISDALVRLTVRGRPESQRTDSNGRYYFDIEGGNIADSASLLVDATDYKQYSINGSLQSLDNQSPNLTRISPSRPGPGAVLGRHPITLRRKDAVKVVVPK